MSKDGYYGDFGSFAEEQEAYEQHMRYQWGQLPEVVPCPVCGDQMYETEDNCGKHGNTTYQPTEQSPS